MAIWEFQDNNVDELREALNLYERLDSLALCFAPEEALMEMRAELERRRNEPKNERERLVALIDAYCAVLKVSDDESEICYAREQIMLNQAGILSIDDEEDQH